MGMVPDDLATWMYAMGFLIKGFGFFLFLWWLRESEWKASSMFIYITLLLLGSAMRDGIETYGGFCRSTLNLSQSGMQKWVYDMWFWPARMVIPNAIFAVLVGHMTYRAFWKRKKNGDT
jgi:hypothetical protein